MSRKIVVVDMNGERFPDGGDWPLKIGCLPGADIRVAGAVADGDIALIDVLDERFFLQRIVDAQGLAVNDEPVVSNRWLDDGDVISARGTTIRCEFDDAECRFVVGSRPVDYPTLPPEAVAADGDIEIRPIRSRAPAALAVTDAGAARRAKIFGIGALLVLLGVASFLFTSKSVLIDIEPPEADVSIAGGLLKLKFGERYLLRPGDYRIRATAEGYVDADMQIVVDEEASQSFSMRLDKQPGRLAVETRPAVVARVSVDGTYLGSTDAGPLAVPAGPHRVLIETDRYLEVIEQIDIEGRDVLQTIDVDLSPGWADVTIASQPVGATIFVDDEAVGETPATVEIMAGNHDVVLRKEGFKPWRRPLTTLPGTATEFLDIRLAEADGLLSVTTRPAGAAVSVNGRYRGNTPLDIDLAPGPEYEVIVTKPGYAAVSRTIGVESKRSRTLALDLEVRTGVMRFSSTPPNAELYVDGKPVGRTGQSLTLPAREHAIEIRLAGYEPFRTTVLPKPGLPGTLEARLLTPEQARLASYPQVIETFQGAPLRLVGPGQFEMGAPRREQGRRPNESQRAVRLTRLFYIAEHEVTNERFRAFKPKHTSGAEKYRQLGDDSHPAVMLSWEDAAGYCNWLSGKDGLPFAYVLKDGDIVLATPPNTGYRLPTEAEWAWAARYGGGAEARKYPWGNRMPPGTGAGNYADESARSILSNVISNYNDGFPITAPVGRFQANPIGIFDLGGNVAEWVNDRYGIHAEDRGVESDPVGPAEGQYHVIRGSGWRHSSIGELRLAYRDFGDRGRLDVGFRIARYVEAPPGARN